MANFIFLKNDSYNSPVVAKLACYWNEVDYDWWHIKLVIKATKRKYRAFKTHAENTTDYMCCDYDYTGSTKERIR